MIVRSRLSSYKHRAPTLRNPNQRTEPILPLLSNFETHPNQKDTSFLDQPFRTQPTHSDSYYHTSNIPNGTHTKTINQLSAAPAHDPSSYKNIVRQLEFLKQRHIKRNRQDSSREGFFSEDKQILLSKVEQLAPKMLKALDCSNQGHAFAEAEQIFLDLFSYTVDLRLQKQFMHILLTLASLSFDFNRLREAVHYYSECRVAAIHLFDFEKLIQSLIGFSKCASLDSQGHEMAIQFLKRALGYAWASGNNELQLNIYEEMGIAFFKAGDIQKASEYHRCYSKGYVEPRDSLIKSNFAELIKKMMKQEQASERRLNSSLLVNLVVCIRSPEELPNITPFKPTLREKFFNQKPSLFRSTPDVLKELANSKEFKVDFEIRHIQPNKPTTPVIDLRKIRRLNNNRRFQSESKRTIDNEERVQKHTSVLSTKPVMHDVFLKKASMSAKLLEEVNNNDDTILNVRNNRNRDRFELKKILLRRDAKNATSLINRSRFATTIGIPASPQYSQVNNHSGVNISKCQDGQKSRSPSKSPQKDDWYSSIIKKVAATRQYQGQRVRNKVLLRGIESSLGSQASTIEKRQGSKIRKNKTQRDYGQFIKAFYQQLLEK